jgi:CRP/FNR family cyclic AMP-dependent transcriptional regulator
LAAEVLMLAEWVILEVTIRIYSGILREQEMDAVSMMAHAPLFAGVPAEQLGALLTASRRRRFGRGEVVFHDGDVGASLHVVIKGRFAVRVSTPHGEEATLVVLPPGEVFGEMALVREDAQRNATVVSLEAGETLSIDRRDFDALRKDRPVVTEVLLTILANKVQRYTSQLLEALYVPAEMRVLRRLLELADVYGPGEDRPAVPLTQEDLAGLAGTSRATVNRVLREEEERGTLSLDRGRTTVLDLAQLRRRARL